LNRFLLLAWALAAPVGAWAHGDEDHGAAPVAAVAVSAAPRLAAQTDQFELVGVLEGKVLRIYLDQFGSNAPVAKAQIEVESGTWRALATEVAPAVYTVPAEILALPGRHALAITVQAGNATDLMDATLEVGPSIAAGARAAPHAHFWGEWAAWSGAAAVALAAFSLELMRRQRARRHAAPLF